MRKHLFNQDWVFRKDGDMNGRVICLPHDAMLEEERDAACAGGSACAFFPGGKYIYEKHFEVPEDWKDKHIEILFEGVYQKSKVFINEKEVGECVYGYVPFSICMDDYLEYGADNVICVQVDNSAAPNTRWYSGSGIYRPVWLFIGEKTFIQREGIRIQTTSVKPPSVAVHTMHNGGDQIQVEILDGTQSIAQAEGDEVKIPLPDAELWDENHPKLYTCKVTLLENGEVKDQAGETFGIRKVSWSEKGLFVNGGEVLLRGGCVHHDNGVLGAATYDESEWRRVQILKEAGYNAIRSSHNPASRAMLDACDSLGIYMMDETWDMWYSHKNQCDYAGEFMDHYKEDIKAMIGRDYNHPSVIMYSIGNEVSEPAKKKGIELAKEMTDYIHQMDDSRAVTAGINLMIIKQSVDGKAIYKEEGGRDASGEEKISGMNSTMFNMITSMVGSSMNKAANGKKADLVTTPVLDTLDIAGYNYASGRYPLEGKAHPKRIIFGSETFPQDIYKNWQMVKKYPYLIGDFMWTAWDYLGEAGIGAWAYSSDGKGFAKPYPWLLADVGTFDILGNPNGEAFWAQAVWGCLDKPAIAVRPANHPGVKPAKGSWRGTNAIPGWSWKDCNNNKTMVEVYTEGSRVELSLNGKKIGGKSTKECRAIFKVKYTPGVLEAVAFDENGSEIGRNQLVSADASADVKLYPEKKTARLGALVYVNVCIADDHDIVECNADREIKVAVEGGELLGFGSANPRTEERYITGTASTYYGRALAVVRGTQEGKLKIKAQSGTYKTEADITILSSNEEQE